MSAPALALRVHARIDELSEPDWESLLGEDPVPSLRYRWIHALEASGSASARTGWEPRHLTLWRGGTLVAAAPAYRKHHSMGEYIYDFSWAQAAAQLGIEYYPKLLLGVPLSPLTAPRILVRPGEEVAPVRQRLLAAALELARDEGCSSVHVLFPPEAEALALEAESGWARRTGMQFHWQNPGYGSYEDFLSRFDAKRRHQLRRERGAAATQGITLHTVQGAELGTVHADRAHGFYLSTCEKNAWGQVQLNRDFFRRVFAALPEAVELVEARREGTVIAGAFNLLTRERRYGRYWGCTEEHPFLHFHVCLYHSIDACIREGRKVFEPGAGGEHKIPRGFVPTAIHSLHRIFDARLDRAVEGFVRREREALQRTLAEAEGIAGMKPWQPQATGS